jgi:hypothetical protein
MFAATPIVAYWVHDLIRSETASHNRAGNKRADEVVNQCAHDSVHSVKFAVIRVIDCPFSRNH